MKQFSSILLLVLICSKPFIYISKKWLFKTNLLTSTTSIIISIVTYITFIIIKKLFFVALFKQGTLFIKSWKKFRI